MIKRPIFLAAVVLTLLLTLIYRFYPEILKPSSDQGIQGTFYLTGTVEQIRVHEKKIGLFLKDLYIGRQEEEHEKLPGKSLLMIEKEEAGDTHIRIGNWILSRCRLGAFEEARNYGNFEEQEYYASLGIFWKGEAMEVTVLDQGTDPVGQFLYDLRGSLVASIQQAAPDPDTAGILAAICTGDRTLLSQDMKALYQRNGIAHILAISGLHISLVGMGIFRLLRKRLRFLPSAVISAVLVAGFCMMTGMQASAVRAAVMFGVQLAAAGLGKTYDIMSSLSLAVILLLISNPLYITNSGFQMSVMAVVSAGLIYRPLLVSCLYRRNKNCPVILKAPENTWKTKALSGLLLSASITLGTLPVIAYIYFEIPVYSVLLNLLVIPVMSLTLGSGMISAVLGIFSVLMGRFFAGAGVYLVQGIEWFCRLIQRLPGSSLVTGRPSLWQIGVYYLLLFAGAGVLEYRNRQRKPVQGRGYRLLGFAIGGIAALIVLFFRIPTNDLRISLIDVDQGECILIESPSGARYLIDSGSTSLEQVARYRVASAVKYRGISEITAAIITHPDTDHMNGILELMENQEILNISFGQLLIPYVPENENYRKLVELAKEKGIPVASLYRGMELRDGCTELSCLHPGKGYVSEELNGYSAVLELKYGDFSALFTGDIGQEEEELLAGRLKSGYDLLKVAHHGSRFSSSSAFLKRVCPDVAVISAGVHNSYGHPHKDTLERLSDAGAEIFVTSQCGEILIEVGEKGKVAVYTKLKV